MVTFPHVPLWYKTCGTVNIVFIRGGGETNSQLLFGHIYIPNFGNTINLHYCSEFGVFIHIASNASQ